MFNNIKPNRYSKQSGAGDFWTIPAPFPFNTTGLWDGTKYELTVAGSTYANVLVMMLKAPITVSSLSIRSAGTNYLGVMLLTATGDPSNPANHKILCSTDFDTVDEAEAYATAESVEDYTIYEGSWPNQVEILTRRMTWFFEPIQIIGFIIGIGITYLDTSMESCNRVYAIDADVEFPSNVFWTNFSGQVEIL